MCRNMDPQHPGPQLEDISTTKIKPTFLRVLWPIGFFIIINNNHRLAEIPNKMPKLLKNMNSVISGNSNCSQAGWIFQQISCRASGRRVVIYHILKTNQTCNIIYSHLLLSRIIPSPRMATPTARGCSSLSTQKEGWRVK